MREDVVINGENLYTAALCLSSYLIFLSLWIKRGKFCSLLKTFRDVKFSKFDKMVILLFHLFTLIAFSLYASVVVPWYLRSMEKCKAVKWVSRLLGISVIWNLLVISLPLIVVLCVSYTSREKFRKLNNELKELINERPVSSFTFKKPKGIHSLRSKYNRLRKLQDESESILHLSVLGNHIFLLVSSVTAMLYLIISLMEKKNQISHSVGVCASVMGIVVIFIKASILELEGKEVRIFLGTEKNN